MVWDLLVLPTGTWNSVAAVRGFWWAPPAPSNPTQLLPGSKQDSGFHLEPLIGAGAGDRASLPNPRGHFPNVPSLSLHTVWPKPLQLDVSLKWGSDCTPQVLLCDLGKEAGPL